MSTPDPRPEPPTTSRRGRPSITPISLLIVLIIFYLIVQVQLILALLLFAILFATVIERPVLKLEARGWPRPAGILTMYVIILAGLVAIGLVFVPLITSEARAFSAEAPELIDELAQNWRTSDNQFLARTGYRYLTQLKFRLENPPPPTGDTALGVVAGIGGGLFGVVATFVIGFYYLMEKQFLRRVILEQLVPASRDRVDTIWRDVEAKVGDWLRGQMLLCLIIGFCAGIGYGVMGLRFWLLLALFAGITELIPIIGPWIGGVPAFVVALLDSWQKAIIVAIFLVLLQLLENTILVPRIMRGAIGLSPLTVFLAVLIGGQYMGVLGALLALPVAAAIQVIVVDAFRNRQLSMEALGPQVPAEPPPDTTRHAWTNVRHRFLEHDDRRRGRATDERKPDS